MKKLTLVSLVLDVVLIILGVASLIWSRTSGLPEVASGIFATAYFVIAVVLLGISIADLKAKKQ